MIRNIRHTGLVVRDLSRSVEFYRKLGLSVWREEVERGPYIEQVTGLSGACLKWAKLKSPDGALLELIEYASPLSAHPPKANSPANRLGCSHVAFTVHDLNLACKLIKEGGGDLVNAPARSPDGGACVVYAYDPDGILIELVEMLNG